MENMYSLAYNLESLTQSRDLSSENIFKTLGFLGFFYLRETLDSSVDISVHPQIVQKEIKKC